VLVEEKIEKNRKRHKRSRKKISGTAERPRLSIFRSSRHLYAQAINDLEDRTLLGVSTLSPGFQKKSRKNSGNVQAAKEFGAYLAEALKKKKLIQIVFDRGGHPYHGRLKALAEALRENGIQL